MNQEQKASALSLISDSKYTLKELNILLQILDSDLGKKITADIDSLITKSERTMANSSALISHKNPKLNEAVESHAVNAELIRVLKLIKAAFFERARVSDKYSELVRLGQQHSAG